MKKLLFILLIFSTNFSMSQIINFPDANFKTKLLQANVGVNIAFNAQYQSMKIDSNNNGEIEVSEALLVYRLSVEYGDVVNLDGLEYFTNLIVFSCRFNPISSFYFPTLNQLQALTIGNSNITSIDCTPYILLDTLAVGEGPLENIDLAGLNLLRSMNFKNTFLNSVDFSSLTSLKYALLSDNQFTSLDFSTNSLLEELVCKNNMLTSINIKNNSLQDIGPTSLFNDCWKTGNPNLTTICADESEVVAVQNFLNSCGTPQTINVTSDCNLSSEDFVNNKVKIFPNPSSGVFTIALPNSIEVRKVQVFSLIGQELYVDFILNTTEKTIDVSHLSKGTYLLKVSGNNSTTEELVVVK
ncbi:T9SS type A sorting domain-containing protein [Flavobacterium sp.]|uniref:T9SS type A sorting domain-containing protein n=1 Tax=Flavobacterium sp. TaxID=239 RepID=UPI0035274856